MYDVKDEGIEDALAAHDSLLRRQDRAKALGMDTVTCYESGELDAQITDGETLSSHLVTFLMYSALAKERVGNFSLSVLPSEDSKPIYGW